MSRYNWQKCWFIPGFRQRYHHFKWDKYIYFTWINLFLSFYSNQSIFKLCRILKFRHNNSFLNAPFVIHDILIFVFKLIIFKQIIFHVFKLYWSWWTIVFILKSVIFHQLVEIVIFNIWIWILLIDYIFVKVLFLFVHLFIFL